MEPSLVARCVGSKWFEGEPRHVVISTEGAPIPLYAAWHCRRVGGRGNLQQSLSLAFADLGLPWAAGRGRRHEEGTDA